MADLNIALNRFGLGARPDEAPPADPRRWLVDQFARYQPALPAAPTSATVASRLRDYYDEQQSLRQQYGPRKQFRQQRAQPAPAMADTPVTPPINDLKPGAAQPAATSALDPFRQARRDTAQDMRAAYAQAVAARTDAALVTAAPFVERLVHFWSNHFAVSTDKLPLVGLGGTFEFEVIRPHVLGRFEDMLLAVERHPAMLLYLDQAVSVGPGSPFGQRAAKRLNGRKPGLNENLAREAMELHTLGVRTGYTQADVTEFARALTGWTVAGIGRGGGAAQGTPGQFVFLPARHEPGARTVIGRRYEQAGEAQARVILADLAASEATATHVCTKLARHFAGDEPPTALVARLKAAWLGSRGDLPTVYRALVASPEPWAPQPAKFRTPWEWSVAAMRALGTRQVQGPQIVGLLNQLGQPVWKPGQPVGYDDVAASWAGPDAVMRRVEAAERFASRAAQNTDARALAPKLFPAAVSPATSQALTRAESPAQALALLLVSPEMMRR